MVVLEVEEEVEGGDDEEVPTHKECVAGTNVHNEADEWHA